MSSEELQKIYRDERWTPCDGAVYIDRNGIDLRWIDLE